MVRAAPRGLDSRLKSFAQRSKSRLYFTPGALKGARYTPQSDARIWLASKLPALVLNRDCLERLAFAPRFAPDFRVKSNHQEKIL